MNRYKDGARSHSKMYAGKKKKHIRANHGTCHWLGKVVIPWSGRPQMPSNELNSALPTSYLAALIACYRVDNTCSILPASKHKKWSLPRPHKTKMIYQSFMYIIYRGYLQVMTYKTSKCYASLRNYVLGVQVQSVWKSSILVYRRI